jgi:lipoprotein-anchoring transpeptidase ErfK/SrfK
VHRRRTPSAVAVVVAAVTLLTACSAPPTHSAPHRTSAVHTPEPHAPRAPRGGPSTAASASGSASAPAPTVPPIATSATVAAVRGASVAVHGTAGGAVVDTVADPQPSGAPLVLLVVGRQAGWLRVAVPTRPNGRTGWVRSGDVQLSSVAYHLVAVAETNTLTLYRAGRPVASYPVASGTGGTPTPHGAFFLTELLRPTNAGYGPYAYGVSAFSEVLTSFGGGPGQIGLHGTDDATSIGRDASHGCIRMRNADITALAGILPLGTPITIV